jgi:hypothetical protein
METAYAFLAELDQHEPQTTILVEERGNKEDRDLESEFRRIRDGANLWGRMPNYEFRCCSKKANASGLQFADLVATPIGRNFLNPDQPNRGYDIIRRKFRRSPTGDVEGWGRKSFS